MITTGLLLVAASGSHFEVPQNENGWPTPPVRVESRPTRREPPRPTRRPVSDFEDRRPAVRGSTATSWRPKAPSQPAPARGTPRRMQDADLHEMFSRVGFPSDMRDLGGVIARMQLRVFDHQGGVLADLKLLHFADLTAGPRRDRIEFSGLPSMNRVYGRNGAAVFAEMYSLAWVNLEKEAAEELRVFGMLLRFPWCFDSGSEFVVAPKERVTIQGKEMVRIRVRRRLPERSKAMTFQPRVDQFDLICQPRTMVCQEVHMIPAATGARVVVKLMDYAVSGDVSIPRRRVFLGSDGKELMEVRILQMDVKQELPASLFRPR